MSTRQNQHGYNVTELIDITDEWVWGSERWSNINALSFFEGSPAHFFGDIAAGGTGDADGRGGHYNGARALPVRAGN